MESARGGRRSAYFLPNEGDARETFAAICAAARAVVPLADEFISAKIAEARHLCMQCFALRRYRGARGDHVCPPHRAKICAELKRTRPDLFERAEKLKVEYVAAAGGDAAAPTHAEAGGGAAAPAHAEAVVPLPNPLSAYSG